MIAARGWTVDAAAAVAVLLMCGVAALETGPHAWWQWLLIGVVAAGVAVRGRWPLPAAAVTLAASAAVLIDDVIPGFAAPGLCAAVALTQYTAAVRRPPSRSVPALAAGLGGAAVLGLWWPVAPLVAGSVVAVSWLTGWFVRRRRHLAERAFQERTARAVTEERLRIARDMHDIVAHSLSMIAMKASVARHVSAVRPEEGSAALEVIETASREALVEIRRAVGVLRVDHDEADQDLRTLTRRTEQAGVRVDAQISGETTTPPAVRLTVYRIVQEALTNVVRHSQATRCSVDVQAVPGSVTVRVVDNGVASVRVTDHGISRVRVVDDGVAPVRVTDHGTTRVPVADSGTAMVTTEDGGHGLRGMRERVTAYGGTLQAGPRESGGFAVTAHIPYGTAEQEWS
ncbi:sensor histidine kinase [Actinoplanes sichuanensis]|uniref:histidine kinase n=1 Tax=Actinoplanes sichuanensis TaxID=512349 RepID=A0ABW4A4X8_9ACTN|nr:sensor histidine kinase [Actinoplanes sichuanensis]BEL05524.1 sensor histidine kinase [Actinoplanes sichuanensis]